MTMPHNDGGVSSQERKRERDKQWRVKNRDRNREDHRARYRREREHRLAIATAYRHANPDKIKIYKEQNRQKILDQERKYWERPENRERRQKRSRARLLATKYGMTISEYEKMFAEQGYACGSCGAKHAGSTGKWHLDHDHRTNLVRGILCHYCNLCIGLAKDSPSALRKMADYIDRHLDLVGSTQPVFPELRVVPNLPATKASA